MRSILFLVIAASLALGDDKPERGFKALFNGKDLTDWTKAKENENSFRVENGAIVANGPRCHLYYTGKVGKGDFKNFELKVDVMTKQNSNGGIYFHTKYQETSWPDKGFEVQVNNTHRDVKKTGGLYNVADNLEKVAEDDKWFTEHIVVNGDKVTVFVDGKKVTEWTQPAGFQGPKGNPGRVLSSGTFAFQAHDPGSTVYYKNVRVKILK